MDCTGATQPPASHYTATKGKTVTAPAQDKHHTAPTGQAKGKTVTAPAPHQHHTAPTGQSLHHTTPQHHYTMNNDPRKALLEKYDTLLIDGVSPKEAAQQVGYSL